MRELSKKEDAILKNCLPEKWYQFTINAPKSFTQKYLDEIGVSREVFLDFADTVQFMDHVFFKHRPDDVVYTDLTILYTCKRWVFSEKQMQLYEALPYACTYEDMRKIRLDLRLPISVQDKLMQSKTLTYYVKGKDNFITHLKKNLIKPITRNELISLL